MVILLTFFFLQTFFNDYRLIDEYDLWDFYLWSISFWQHSSPLRLSFQVFTYCILSTQVISIWFHAFELFNWSQALQFWESFFIPKHFLPYTPFPTFLGKCEPDEIMNTRSKISHFSCSWTTCALVTLNLF